MKPTTTAIWLVLSAILVGAGIAQVPRGPYPMSGRSSDDRDADLIDALIGQAQFDAGEKICASMLAKAVPTTDEAAKWSIYLSEIRTARYQSTQQFDDTKIAQAQSSVQDLLTRYSEHPRNLFLQAQSLRVRLAAAKHAIVVASVAPESEPRQDEILVRTTQINSGIQQLIEIIRQRVSRLITGNPTLEDRALAADLQRLDHELQVDSVSLKLMQSEVFKPGTRDFVDASGQAAIQADETLQRLPGDATARLEVRRLFVDALIRAGQVDRAKSELAKLISQLGQVPPPSVIALMVQLALQENNTQRAQALLDAVYGSDPKNAPRGIPLDLARLSFLLTQPNDQSAIGQWLSAIEQRGGPFARRRAESIALSRLRELPSPSSADASLIAAEGEDWLRRGEPLRAAQLLFAAAKAEGDAPKSLTLATKSAAAFIAAKQARQAAAVLSHVAKANRDAKGASQLQLQAVHLLAQQDDPDLAATIERALKDLIQTWPQGESTTAAQKWLLKILDSQKRSLEAAESATEYLKADSSIGEINDALQRWTQSIVQSPQKEAEDGLLAFQNAFRSVKERSAEIATAYARHSVLLLDRPQLAGVSISPDADHAAFIQGLLTFRQKGQGLVGADGVPDRTIEVARWRLYRDGDQDPSKRKSIAAAIAQWPSDDPWQSVKQKLWSGNEAAAISEINSLLQASEQPGTDRRRAAEVLGSHPSETARAAAIGFWDELASGLPRGSQSWHDAKLAAIDLLRQTGKASEAQRRAKYVLLTNPPANAALRSRYEVSTKQ